MKERGKPGQPSVDERYTQWKSLVPVLYDWLANHNLVWPSLSCRYSLLFLLGFHQRLNNVRGFYSNRVILVLFN